MRPFIEEGAASLVRAAYRPLDEETNRPPSPGEGFCGEASTQISAQAPNRSLASGTQSDNQIFDWGRESSGTGPSEPENPFVPLSIVETPYAPSSHLLFFSVVWFRLCFIYYFVCFDY